MTAGLPDEDREPDGRRRRGLRRRAALIEAVLAVVARHGVAGVSHGSVATEAGLPRSAVSHHFDALDDLLSAALRSATEHLVAAVPHVPAGSDVRWFASELVGLFAANRDRVAAGYELYALAARRPSLRDAVALWTGLLADLARHHTTDPDRVRGFAVTVDGYFLQALATGDTPRVGELETLLRTALGSGQRSASGYVTNWS
ncbi:TetR/AcrR family transcriptional regulator [Actinomycetospora chiangmaiensis]|uniref:TetR/AcrR family transcriptional regulator n=1 Tax=Actinomycetospora chiangmaiensis TaxID=402650 RepID=UPI00035F0B10|nr:TetR family transcriptional regulator [Actinomycetospora chiangmaiensis]